MGMESIRILDDDSRFYIVIENPTIEAKKAAIEFVATRLGVGKKVQEELPMGVFPVAVMDYEVPNDIPEVEIKTSNGFIIPDITNAKLFIEWWLKYEHLNIEMQHEALPKLKSFMINYLKRIHRSEKEEVEKFLMDFEPIFENTIKKVLRKNGYNNLKAFLSTESEGNIKAAFDVCKNGICSILDIK